MDPSTESSRNTDEQRARSAAAPKKGKCYFRQRCGSRAVNGQRFCLVHMPELIPTADGRLANIEAMCRSLRAGRCVNNCPRPTSHPGAALCHGHQQREHFASPHAKNRWEQALHFAAGELAPSQPVRAADNTKDSQCQFIVAGKIQNRDTLKYCIYPPRTAGGLCRYHFLQNCYIILDSEEHLCSQLFCRERAEPCGNNPKEGARYCDYHQKSRNRFKELGICRTGGCHVPAKGVHYETHGKSDSNRQKQKYDRSKETDEH